MKKSNEQLLKEIAQLQAKIADLEKSYEEHKNTENALKQSEERYNGIFQSMASCVAVYKPIDNGKNFIIVDFNQLAEKIENISKNEIIGRKVTEVFPGVLEFGIFKVFQNVLKTGKPEHFPVSVYKDERIQGYRENYVYKLSSGEIVAVYQDLTERKKVENELAKLQLLYDETEKAAKIGGWTFDIETMEQTWTDGIFCILEIDLSMGAPKVPKGITFIDPPYRQMAESAIQKSIENGEPYDQEWIVTTSKGNKRWVQAIANPHVENGKTIKISGSFQDITDRKQVEEALSKSEQKFKMLVTNIEEIIYLVDKNGIFTVSEGKGLEKLGLKPGQVVGMSVFDFYKDYPGILKGIKKALNGETNGIEVQIGPNYFTNWSTPHFNPEGEVIGLIGLAINITERKQAEIKLLKEKEYSDEMINALPGVFYQISNEGKFLNWNKDFEIVSGYSAEEMSKISPIDLFEGEDKKRIAESIAQVFSHGSVYVEANLTSKTGSKVPYFFTGKRIMIDALAVLVGMGMDVSELKKAENELKKHREHLEELVKERTKDLETKNKELDNAMKVFVGRELAIRNLQDRIRALEGK
ncbi:MAG: PAS domain S-box protein [Bacteroidetes bacterium]|nr:PAS domain S-box protein [Bacteroidota bacterium]